MRVYLIRHGQSTNNARPTPHAPRTEDPILTELGHRQAERLAQFMATHTDAHPISIENQVATQKPGDFGITRLYCSPMWRALQTALPISLALRLTPEVWDDIHEHGGIFLEHDGQLVGYPGKTRAEILATFPDYILPTSITERGWWNRDYETFEATHIRGAIVADRLRQMARDDTSDAQVIALVSHQYFLWTVLKALFRWQDESIKINHYNSGFSRLDFTADDQIYVRYINRLDHLTADLFTA
ncbi:MAG: histidine phosphatase family protein [Chloroflexi bacterium]|nr:histidine phosphatase family protein [Chloroflexota bacterium]